MYSQHPGRPTRRFLEKDEPVGTRTVRRYLQIIFFVTDVCGEECPWRQGERPALDMSGGGEIFRSTTHPGAPRGRPRVAHHSPAST